jgi:hypothetical protein
MADGQRTGGIGTDKFNHHPPAVADIRTTVRIVLTLDFTEQMLPDRLSNSYVDEARASDLHPVEKIFMGGKTLSHLGGYFPGIFLFNASQDKGDIGGKIALVFMLGYFHRIFICGGSRPLA